MRFLLVVHLSVLLAACGPKPAAVEPDSPPWVHSDPPHAAAEEGKDSAGDAVWEETLPAPPWHGAWQSPELRRSERTRMRFELQLQYFQPWGSGRLGNVQVVDDRGERIWHKHVEVSDRIGRSTALVHGSFCAFPDRGYNVRMTPVREREPVSAKLEVRFEPPRPIVAKITRWGSGGEELMTVELDRGVQEGVVPGARARYGQRTLLITRATDHKALACVVAESEPHEGPKTADQRVLIESCPTTVFSKPLEVCREGLPASE